MRALYQLWAMFGSWGEEQESLWDMRPFSEIVESESLVVWPYFWAGQWFSNFLSWWKASKGKQDNANSSLFQALILFSSYPQLSSILIGRDDLA